MAKDSSPPTEFEPLDSELLPRQVEAPPHFEADEWKALTGGFVDEHDEIAHVIAKRGGEGSKKGRPVNLSVPHSGPLSMNAHAVAQRDRAARMSLRDAAMKRAGDADRQALFNLKRKLEKKGDIPEKKLKQEQDVLNEKRFRDHKSCEWLETELLRVETKWADIQTEVSRRKLNAVLGTKEEELEELDYDHESRQSLRMYGSGGAYEKIMRDCYHEGLSKMNNNSFESKDEREEWEQFVATMSPEMLAVVQDTEWRRKEPSPLPELDEEEAIDADHLHTKAQNSDECDEDGDDEEVEAFYNNMSEDDYASGEDVNEYKASGDEASEDAASEDEASGDEARESGKREEDVSQE